MISRHRHSYSILLFNALLLLSACANMVTPEGGPDDNDPPVADYFSPENNSVNFASNSITIKFNEYIQLNNIFNQVLISPPMSETPDFKLKGKTLTITLNSPLKDSTTYTINFGQSIKDITKGNTLDNFTYVFSTGDFLDSLEVSGKITDLLTGSPSSTAFAVLYLNSNDSAFLNQPPYYFAKVDETGSFTIKNIRSGNYRLYAIEDQNFNYYFDLPNEKIAFLSDEIKIDSVVPNQKLRIFLEDKQTQNLNEIKSPAYATTRLVFSAPTYNVSINYIGDGPENGLFLKSKNTDTILYFNKNYHLEKHIFSIAFDTTILTKEVEVKKAPDDSLLQKSKNTFTVNTPFIKGGGRADWDLKKDIILSFLHPLDTSLIGEVKIRKDTSDYVAALQHIDASDSRKLIISYPWAEATNYDIHIPQNITKDIFGLSNDSMTIKIKTKKETDYASLAIQLSSEANAGIIFQVLSFDQQLVIEKYLDESLFNADTHTVVLDHLLPGIYKIKAVVDIDGNGKWTAGDLLMHKQPEPVYFFPVDQNLRANWKNELEWDLNSRN